jgi:4-hydroxy-tetrahydrodipicolinate synthase
MAKNKAPEPARGVYADLATPRRANSTEADAAVFLDYLDSVVRAGGDGSNVDGLVLFGSTGEFIHFDVAERMRAAGLAIRRSRVPVLIGVSHSTLEGALELAEQAVAINAAGVLLMPPYFYRYPEDQIFHFYERFVQESEGTPIYLHDSPLSANPMSQELICRLLNTGAFAGVLREQGTVETLFEAHSVALLAGDEALVAGAEFTTGIVSSIAAALPELPVALYRASVGRELEHARELRSAFEELLSQVGAFPAVVALKRAAIARGWMNQPIAVPPDTAMQARLQVFEEWFKGWLPGVLSKCATKR